jgi:hypothetical protein
VAWNDNFPACNLHELGNAHASPPWAAGVVATNQSEYAVDGRTRQNYRSHCQPVLAFQPTCVGIATQPDCGISLEKVRRSVHDYDKLPRCRGSDERSVVKWLWERKSPPRDDQRGNISPVKF